MTVKANEDGFIPCPFCGGYPRIVVLDDEGNVHDEAYEKNPWSGLRFGLIHYEADCPVSSGDPYEPTYRFSYDTRKHAVEDWNTRINMKRGQRT